MSLLKYLLWLRDYGIDRFRRALLGVLKAGPIPQHVAFIMDGNRRYAHDKGVKVIQGHVDGFVALRRVRAAQAMIATSPSKKNFFFFFANFFYSRDRYWKYVRRLTSRSFLHMPLLSTTSSAPKTKWMGLCT
jgi:undecaprenyl pyrophosphate synthase